jgi:hypothetical protein
VQRFAWPPDAEGRLAPLNAATTPAADAGPVQDGGSSGDGGSPVDGGDAGPK